MTSDQVIAVTAQLFRTLGSESRLRLLLLIADAPTTVTALSLATGLSQPLVSQHVRSLRENGLVSATRHGKEVLYELVDTHVAHIAADAVQHAAEVPGDVTVITTEQGEHAS